MDARMLTLFDLEPLEQEPKPVPKKRADKSKNAAKTEKEPEIIEDKEESMLATEDPKLELQKNYYSIGETAKMFGVRTSHIRFWTVQFALKVRTNRKGDRLYSPENIALLKTINQLVKVEGFTIAGAKVKLKELKKAKPNVAPQPSQKAILAALHSLRHTLISLRKNI